jgi:hypothetical protein
MTIVAGIEAAVIVVIAVFLVGLLRSHAEILRRLATIERGAGDPAGSGRSGRPGDQEPWRSGDGGRAERASDVTGVTLAGDAVKLGLGPGSESTLLAFLSSGCAACEPLWATLREGAEVPGGARVVIVAKDRDNESSVRLGELAPPGRELVLSSRAWRDYGVPASPHFVLVDGQSGTIAGSGTGLAWDQIASLIDTALRDAGDTAARPTTTFARAAHAEEVLERAGIGPGHPSLYPSGRETR